MPWCRPHGCTRGAGAAELTWRVGHRSGEHRKLRRVLARILEERTILFVSRTDRPLAGGRGYLRRNPGGKASAGTSRPLQPIRKDLVIRFRRQRLAKEAIMAAKEISVKKYVVRLSGEERERLETLLRKGKSPARRVLK